jgi:hypothetical protein
MARDGESQEEGHLMQVDVEDRRQTTDDRRRGTGDGEQRTEDRRRKTDDG